MSDDRRTRLAVVETSISTTEEAIRRRELVHAELSRQLAALGQPSNQLEARDEERLRFALRQIDEGVTANEGVEFPELQPFLGQLGLLQLRRTLAKLRAEATELRSAIERWPNEEVRHPYRYTGRPGRATVDGQKVQRGEVVQLNEVQARAWKDRFEAVVDEPAQEARG